MGAVTPLGQNVEESWQRLCAGESGVKEIRLFDATSYQTRIAAEVHQLKLPADLDGPRLKRMARFALFALLSAREAWDQAGLAQAHIDPYQIGVLVGSSHGGEEALIEGLEHILHGEPQAVSPRMITRMLTNMATVQIARQFQLHGPAFSLGTACATGAQAIGEAAEIIRRGDATAMICGGAEACITPLTLVGDQVVRALSTRNDKPQQACRPFDCERDGFVLGEGAGILVLEEYEHARARGAVIYAEIAGYGNTTDALHEARPDPEGLHLAQAIRQALRKADQSPTDVDAIFAHATGTLLGDRAEVAALKTSLGKEHCERIPVVALKAALGHALGAAGAIQTLVAVKALYMQMLPPTLNVEHIDPRCAPLTLFSQACQLPLHSILSNAAGFGGHNVVLLLRYLLE
jgi:3-oxoacyl-[acyl-carrier-protein] synthase II